MSNCQYCDLPLTYGNCTTCDTQGADMMTNDEHVMETFGPLEDLGEVGWEDGEEFAYDEAHYHSTLRAFEDLVEEFGVHRVFSDMDDDIVDMMERHAMGLNADKR